VPMQTTSGPTIEKSPTSTGPRLHHVAALVGKGKSIGSACVNGRAKRESLNLPLEALV